MSSREIEAEVIGRAQHKHGLLMAACDDASDELVIALARIDRKRILKLARDANYTLEQVERYIVERTVKLLSQELEGA